MSIRSLMLSAAMLGFALPSPAAESLKFDADNSKVDFVGSKPDGTHDGGFKKVRAMAVADFDDPSASSLKIEIDTTSLWSDNTKLTNHLKNPDFFDVRKYPKITFESTEIVPGDEEGKATIHGKMTMLEKTVEVKIPVTVEADDSRVVVMASFTIDRTEWGMDYGQGRVDNEVKIKAQLAFTR